MTSSTLLNALVQHQQQQQQNQTKTQQKQQIRQPPNDISDPATHLPTVLGLRIRNLQQQQQLQQQCSTNSNSLLKQQLRAGLKEITDVSTSGGNNAMKVSQNPTLEVVSSTELTCSALQSLANVADRQPPAMTLQPPTANDLQQQFLLHMAANPMLKTSSEFFQRQQQQLLEQQQQQQPTDERDDDVELLLDQNDKSEPDLLLVDETLGLEYKSPDRNEASDGANASHEPAILSSAESGSKSSRPIQRRRVRRKAQSTLDDQAEHLTEMSVRGLDLFRYASISEGVYQCTECAKENVQKTFKNKYSFQRHAFLYHEGKHRKVFPCPLCGKEFSRPDKMKNHMKMTHENYVSNKEMANFSPLNYLITAAAAGEMHASLFTQQQQQQQHEHQLRLEQLEQLQEQQQQQFSTSLAGLSVSLETAKSNPDSEGNQNVDVPPQNPSSATDISAAALLKLQNDIVIKNEIVISPSPSPPPPPTQLSITSTPKSKSTTLPFQQQQQHPTSTTTATTQRLEEVK